MNIEQRCQCGFTVMNILEPNFLCFSESEDAVTYRAEIIGSGVDSPTDIVTHIQNWLAPGLRVQFGIILIAVDGSCQVVVASVRDPECTKPAESFQPSVLGGVLGVVLTFRLFVIIVIITLIVCCWKRKRLGHLEITRDRYVGWYVWLSVIILYFHVQEGNRAGSGGRESKLPARRV